MVSVKSQLAGKSPKSRSLSAKQSNGAVEGSDQFSVAVGRGHYVNVISSH